MQTKNGGIGPIVLNLHTVHFYAPAALTTGKKQPISIEDKTA
jgi:hypothetical protein